MLSLVLAESALELVPHEIQSHTSVISHARKLSKNPSEILLDNSWHFAAMKGIHNEIKRGRPDLVHFAILEATTIPLFYKKMLRLFVHTINDKVISFNENVQIPKSYHRFEGLFEKLFFEKSINFEGKRLLEIKEQSFSELIDELDPPKVIGLSTDGKKSSYQDVASRLSSNDCLVVGGFQKDHFSEPITKKLDGLFSIDSMSLESHVVISRMLYEYEKTIFM